MSMLGCDAFGMELHAVHRQLAVGEAHDEASAGLRRYRELVRHGVVVNHQRVIARRQEWSVDAAEYAVAAVTDLGDLAMRRRRRSHHAAAEHLSNRLMAEADAEHRDGGSSRGDQLQADTRFVRGA